MDSKKWFKEAQFGLMIHWGLYSILAGEYKGQRMDYIGEWIQSKYRIPREEYSKLAEVFNPIYFDAEEWVQTAKAAGMKYIVMTSKHHDGFCLFKSEVDNFNVVDATPFSRGTVYSGISSLPIGTSKPQGSNEPTENSSLSLLMIAIQVSTRRLYKNINLLLFPSAPPIISLM